jgi:hypothetical protein
MSDFKTTIKRMFWRIEAKPEGGFIARCSDATVPPLEGATREELQKKIQEKLVSDLGSQFPGLALNLGKPVTKSVSVVTLEKGSTAPESAAPAAQGVKGAIERWVTENAESMLENKFPPELVEQLKSQAVDGKMKIMITKTTTGGSGTLETRANTVSFGGDKLPFGPPSPASQAAGSLPPSSPVSASFSGSQLDTGSPITPVSGSSSFLKVLFAALVVLGLLFISLHLKK